MVLSNDYDALGDHNKNIDPERRLVDLNRVSAKCMWCLIMQGLKGQ